MDFYLVLSREVCPRSSRPHSRSMNQEEEEELQFKISPREWSVRSSVKHPLEQPHVLERPTGLCRGVAVGAVQSRPVPMWSSSTSTTVFYS
jgi:hypothetical protein